MYSMYSGTAGEVELQLGEHSAQAACGRREVQCCSGEDVAC